MCRLFGLAGHGSAAAYYLLDASNSMRVLGAKNPHGWGIGAKLEDGLVLDKSMRSAVDDPRFARQPWLDSASAIITHDRLATVGAPSLEGAQPFYLHNMEDASQGLLLAHNGTFQNLRKIEREAGPYAHRFTSPSDSERYAALVQQRTDMAGGNLLAGTLDAGEILYRHAPLTTAHAVVHRGDKLVAFRSTESHRTVWMLRQGARDVSNGNQLVQHRNVFVPTSTPVTQRPATIFASEPLDAKTGWVELPPHTAVSVDLRTLAETWGEVAARPARRLPDNFTIGGAPPIKANAERPNISAAGAAA